MRPVFRIAAAEGNFVAPDRAGVLQELIDRLSDDFQCDRFGLIEGPGTCADEAESEFMFLTSSDEGLVEAAARAKELQRRRAVGCDEGVAKRCSATTARMRQIGDCREPGCNETRRGFEGDAEATYDDQRVSAPRVGRCMCPEKARLAQEIVVQKQDELPSGSFDRRVPCRTDTARSLPQHSQVSSIGSLIQELWRPVRRAVVHDDHLEARRRKVLLQHSRQRSREQADAIPSNDDR